MRDLWGSWGSRVSGNRFRIWNCTLWGSRIWGSRVWGFRVWGSRSSRATDFGSGTVHSGGRLIRASRGSGNRFWIWLRELSSGGLESGGLESGGLEARATDFGPGAVSSESLESGGLESGGLQGSRTDFGSGRAGSRVWRSRVWGSRVWRSRIWGSRVWRSRIWRSTKLGQRISDLITHTLGV